MISESDDDVIDLTSQSFIQIFCLQATEDEMRLLRFQRKLDDEKGAGLLGLSLQVHKGAGHWDCLHVHKGAGVMGLSLQVHKGVWVNGYLKLCPGCNHCLPCDVTSCLQATMEALLALGLHKQAEQLYRDFKVPDKRWDMSLLSVLWLAEHMIVCLTCLPHLCRYWWLKLKSLAEKEEWEELEKFSKSKKSPIGYLVRTTPPPCFLF